MSRDNPAFCLPMGALTMTRILQGPYAMATFALMVLLASP